DRGGQHRSTASAPAPTTALDMRESASGCAPKRSGNLRPPGKRLSRAVAMIFCEPGPGVWPLQLAKRQRWGEDGRSPGFKPLLASTARSSGPCRLLDFAREPVFASGKVF